jgi:hypothetical protein
MSFATTPWPYGIEISHNLALAISLRRCGRHARTPCEAKPVNSVQIAETLLGLEGAASLVELFSSGRKCDAVPVQFAMLKMFPDTAYEDLASGLRLAVTLARLDEAEAAAMGQWRAVDGVPRTL